MAAPRKIRPRSNHVSFFPTLLTNPDIVFIAAYQDQFTDSWRHR